MAQNLYRAHREWATRPADERFPDIETLYDHVQRRRNTSFSDCKNLSDIRLTPTNGGDILLNGNSPASRFSNWSFSQLCSIVGAPAKYLRELPAELAAECMQYGLKKSDSTAQILYRNDANGTVIKTAAAFTSEKYGRIWDSDVVRFVLNATRDSAWRVPPARPNMESENSGLYASDHDVFMFFVNDSDPIEVGNAKLGRGFFCWNSEVGSATFGLTTFLYNYVCGNHIVWGAEDVNELKIIHRKHAPQSFRRTALPVLSEYARSSSGTDSIKRVVETASETQVGNILEDVLSYFKSKPFTRKEVTAAYEIADAEGEDNSNLWGMVQGLTAQAREIPFTDKRVNLERRAGRLLAMST